MSFHVNLLRLSTKFKQKYEVYHATWKVLYNSLSNSNYNVKKIIINFICYSKQYFVPTPHTKFCLNKKCPFIIVFTSIAIWKRLVIYVLFFEHPKSGAMQYPYFYRNIGRFSIAPYKIVTINLLRFGISSLLFLLINSISLFLSQSGRFSIAFCKVIIFDLLRFSISWYSTYYV